MLASAVDPRAHAAQLAGLPSMDIAAVKLTLWLRSQHMRADDIDHVFALQQLSYLCIAESKASPRPCCWQLHRWPLSDSAPNSSPPQLRLSTV